MHKKLSLNISLCTSLIVALYSVKSNEPLHFGIAPKIVIKSNQVTPARAAFEDMYDPIELQTSETEDEILVNINLNNNSKPSKEFYAFIEKRIHEQNINPQQEVTPEETHKQYVMLSGLKIKTDTPELMPVPEAVQAQINDNIIHEDQDVIKVQTHLGFPILVSKGEKSFEPVVTKKLNQTIPPPPEQHFITQKKPTEPEETSNDYSVVYDNGPINAVTTSATSEKGNHISGRLELAQGVPYYQQLMTLEAYWQSESGEIKKAQVFEDEGTFTVEPLSSGGKIVAELWHNSGFVIARGEMVIKKETEISISLKPSSNEMEATFTSTYSPNEKVSPDKVTYWPFVDLEIPVAGGKVNFKQFTSNSTLAVLSHKQGFWSSLQFLNSNKTNRVQMYTNSYIDSLLSLTQTNSADVDPKELGIIIGQVVKDGAPVPHAQVEFSDPNVKPIYFSGFLPNKSIQETDESGVFVLVNVKPGLYSVRSKTSEGVFAEQFVGAEKHTVTNLLLEIGLGAKAEVNIYDAFLGKYLDAQIEPQGTEQLANVNQGRAMLLLSGGTAPEELNIFAGDEYIPTRIAHSQKAKKIDIPLVSKAKMNELLSHEGLTLQEAKVQIVGFVEGDDYFVELNPSSREKVIYFDKVGQVTTKGVMGGGFIVNGGLEEKLFLTIESTKTGVKHSQLFWMQEGTIQLTTQSF